VQPFFPPVGHSSIKSLMTGCQCCECVVHANEAGIVNVPEFGFDLIVKIIFFIINFAPSGSARLEFVIQLAVRHSPSSLTINYNSQFGILLSPNRKKAKANSEHCLCTTTIYSAFVYRWATFLISLSWRKVKIFVITPCVCVWVFYLPSQNTNKSYCQLLEAIKRH